MAGIVWWTGRRQAALAELLRGGLVWAHDQPLGMARGERRCE